MEARTHRALILALLLSGICGTGILGTATSEADAASARTRNFLCEAPTPELAERFCQAAEQFRRDLAIQWLGQELPAWESPCPITCEVGPKLGAGGATSFVFQNGNVHGWRMNVQGSEIRILDSVLPHEVTHTIFATHFRQPLPRWADEGACTTVEHSSEKARHHQLLITFLKTNRGIPFDRMFAMKEYPSDILPLYAQGHSLARFLIAQSGQQQFLKFVGDGMGDENWPRALSDHYGYRDLGELQTTWVDWVRAGSPLDVQSPLQVAAARETDRGSNVTFASDSPRPNELAHDQAFDYATRAENSPLTFAPQGASPQVDIQLPSGVDGPGLQWRPTGTPTASAAPVSSNAPASRPASIYQAVRPQPLTPATQQILE